MANENEMQEQETSPQKGGYGMRRSPWRWVGLYVVVAAVLYTAGFYIFRESTDNAVDDTGMATSQTASLY